MTGAGAVSTIGDVVDSGGGSDGGGGHFPRLECGECCPTSRNDIFVASGAVVVGMCPPSGRGGGGRRVFFGGAP